MINCHIFIQWTTTQQKEELITNECKNTNESHRHFSESRKAENEKKSPYCMLDDIDDVLEHMKLGHGFTKNQEHIDDALECVKPSYDGEMQSSH